MKETKQAVLDRIVDHCHAVLLVGDNETEMMVDARELPEDVKEGAVVTITLEAGQIVSTALDSQQTEQRDNRISEKMRRLREGRGSRFKKK